MGQYKHIGKYGRFACGKDLDETAFPGDVVEIVGGPGGKSEKDYVEYLNSQLGGAIVKATAADKKAAAEGAADGK